MTRTLVIGGGPAGAAAACRLAAAGRPVVVVERSADAHDKVCGEFLSGDAARLLAELGIEPDRLGAPRLDRVLVAVGGRIAAATLPFPAWGLSRRRLDAALLARAAALGAEIRRGVAVRRLAPTGRGWQASLDDGSAIAAGAAILATGKHAFPGVHRGRRRSAPMVGFKLHLRAEPAAAARLAGTVAIILFPGGYAGLQPVEDGCLNLCLVVSAGRFAALGRAWPRLVAEIAAQSSDLGDLIAGAQPLWPRPLAIAGVPYGFVRRDLEPDLSGLTCIGDQAAVIPSFTGDGLAIALCSARLAADGCLAGLLATDVHRRIRQAVRRPMAIAGLLSAVAGSGLGRAAAIRMLVAAPGLLAALARSTRLSTPDGGTIL